MTAGTIILILKGAVAAVTVLLILSLAALARGNYRLHGRINLLVFVLTLTALFGLEFIARFAMPTIFSDHFEHHGARQKLLTHLCFSVPAAIVLPLMLYTGLQHYRRVHIGLGILFLILWTGTFITGIFFLPHTDV